MPGDELVGALGRLRQSRGERGGAAARPQAGQDQRQRCSGREPPALLVHDVHRRIARAGR